MDKTPNIGKGSQQIRAVDDGKEWFLSTLRK
jgi:hypothetical protein